MKKIIRKILGISLALVIIISICGCSSKTKDIEPSVEAAEDFLDDGNIEEAIDMLETMVNDDDEDYQAWEALVEAYMEDDSYDDAADALSDMGKVIEDNYTINDKDIEDAMDIYSDLAEELLDDDDDLEIASLDYLLLVTEAKEPIVPNDTETIEPEPTEPEPTQPANSEDNLEGSYTIYGITLADGELITVFNEDGSTLTTNNMPATEFSNKFGINLYDNYNDIQAAVENYFGQYGVVATMTDFVPLDNTAVVTILLHDFKDIFTIYYDSTNDLMADLDYETYDDMQAELGFTDYHTNDLLYSDEFMYYGNNFIIALGGNEYGAYFSFPSQISAINDVEYAYIDDYTLYISDNAYGFVMLSEALNTESTDTSSQPTQFIYSVDDIDLRIDQAYVDMHADGSSIMALNLTSQGLSEFLGRETSIEDEDLITNLTAGISITDIMTLNYIEKFENSLALELGLTDMSLLEAYAYHRFDQLLAEYPNYEAALEDHPFHVYQTGSTITANNIDMYYGFTTLINSTTDNGEYYRFPYEISLIESTMNYTVIDDFTIFVPENEMGYVVIDGEIDY